MFGLDHSIAGFSDGTTLLVVVAVAILLGLRHASDPDHLAAVTTLLASKKERGLRSAASLGFTWGLGHATSLFAFGVPIVLYKAYLPEAVQSGAETAIGFVIIALAVWLLDPLAARRVRRSRARRPGALALARSSAPAALAVAASGVRDRRPPRRSAAARASASWSSRRSPTVCSPWSRSASSPSSPRCRWRCCPAGSG